MHLLDMTPEDINSILNKGKLMTKGRAQITVET